MKDETLRALKDARKICARTVDKSTLEKLDKAIAELESHSISHKSFKAWLAVAMRIMILMRFLAGFDSE